MVRRGICFSDGLNVQGTWRYRDEFQIVPAPDDAPRPKYSLGAQPFVIEVMYQPCNNILVSGARALRALRSTVLKLVPFYFLDNRGAKDWVSDRIPYFHAGTDFGEPVKLFEGGFNSRMN